MRRREFLCILGAVASGRPVMARAQQRMARVGVLVIGKPVAARDLELSSELARMGYLEGRNIAYEIRAAEGDFSGLSTLAKELVATKPDVLICATAAVAKALAAATREIPIIITVTADPIAFGFSDSLSRPSRNITGFTSSSPSLASKRLELLRELVPDLRKIAYLGPPAGTAYAIYEQHVFGAARTLGITVFSVPITTVDSVAKAFEVIDREMGRAVMVGINPTIVELSAHITNECMIRDLPAIHPLAFEVHAGALMSYGPTSLENHAGAARYVDRLLKGTKISDLPFQEPTEFRLAINLRTARSIKINIPPTLLARANEVID